MHFYIQSILVLIALSFAVQIPSGDINTVPVVIIEFILVIYQLGMSIMLNIRLKRKTQLLRIHLFGSLAYIVALFAAVKTGPEWLDEWFAINLILIIPWIFILLFLVTLDELENIRHYRL